MSVDREAILKQAEKLLRQGKLDGAIEAYVRLVEDQPRDWNSINALGDLYARAGRADRAAEHYIRVADHLFDEGFLPKAAAVYKKTLKLQSGDEHAMLRLADIAAAQELFADARTYLRQVTARRRERGDEQGALECTVRVGSLEDADPPSQMAAAAAAGALGDTARAIALYDAAAGALDDAGRAAEALDALGHAARLDPAAHERRGELARRYLAAGDLECAGQWLSRETAGDDPDLLIALGRLDAAAGRAQDVRATVTRVLAVAPDRRPDLERLAHESAAAGHIDGAYGCLEMLVDDAVLAGDWDAAIDALDSFTGRRPHIPALLKLVEIAVDAGRDEATRTAQARLAEAYIVAGRAADARMIAEDLVAADPRSDEHVERLRRVLTLLGVSDAEEVIARYREPIELLDEVPASAAVGSADAPTSADADAGVAEEVDVFAAAPAAVTRRPEEIDLSEMLSGLAGAASVPALPAKNLDDIFTELRSRVSREADVAQALGRFQQGLERLDGGREDEAIADLEAATRAPILRFPAAARLGRLYMQRGDLARAVEWLERAAEAPAPDPDEGRAVLYELASALEGMGEADRALAVLMEIDADSAAYRDVPQRIEQIRTAGRA